MGEEGKKISFGFSKLKKPTNLIKPVVEEKKEIEYVDSFDGAKGKFSYKGSVRNKPSGFELFVPVHGGETEEPTKKDLVIPLLGTKTALEVIKARLEERQKAEEKHDPPQNGTDVQIKTEPPDEGEPNQLSIEELAAKEIMSEAQGGYIKEETSNGLVISTDEKKPNFEGQVEATLEDYENVPVTEYGLAMLRGMGWKPDKKKDPKDEVELPMPRPKGLGLGAERVVPKPSDTDEDLTIGVKSYVKFISGSNNGRYGQVEAVDGDTNRVVVKLALGGTVSVSEVIITPVTKKDYEKNSKIINSVKYEQYKELSEKKAEEKISHRKEKYERSRERKNSDSDTDSKKGKKGHRHKSSRRNRDSDDDSDSSEEERERKHKKKNKKDKSRSNSRDKRHKKKKKKKYSSDSESPPRRSRDYDSHKSKSRR